MQRNNNGRNQYFNSGVPSYRTPGGKKRSPVPGILRLVGVAILILALLIGGGYGIVRLFSQSNKPVRINAKPTDNMQPFGENLIYYDGMTLNCVRPNGSSAWQYSLGTGGDYWCSDTMIAAWTSNQLVILDKGGKPTYTDRMESTIYFVRVGEAYVAACYGEDELTSRIRIMTHTGAVLETLELDDLYLLDAGFFYTRGQLMWVLGLDVNGNAPMVNLSTYEPGKMSTGAVELPDELAYYVYIHNNNLMVVDTSKIRTYNYKCVEQTDIASVLVYGWQIQQVQAVGRNTYALLQQMPSAGDVSTFSELRLVTNYSVKSLRLLTPCFASGLSEKGVYGIGANVIYYAPYGTTTFKATNLTYTISNFVCMLNGGQAVIVSGNDVFITKLPT